MSHYNWVLFGVFIVGLIATMIILIGQITVNPLLVISVMLVIAWLLKDLKDHEEALGRKDEEISELRDEAFKLNFMCFTHLNGDDLFELAKSATEGITDSPKFSDINQFKHRGSVYRSLEVLIPQFSEEEGIDLKAEFMIFKEQFFHCDDRISIMIRCECEVIGSSDLAVGEKARRLAAKLWSNFQTALAKEELENPYHG